MGTLSIWQWLLVLVIILLIFGTKKLPNIGQDLGGAVGARSALIGRTPATETKSEMLHAIQGI